MGQRQTAEYISILGSPAKPIVVELTLPRIGEHDSKWVIAESIGKQYFHYAFRIHPRAQPVNVHVYGKREFVIECAKAGTPVVAELELVVKKIGEREFILINLYLTAPQGATHELWIRGCSFDSDKRPWFVYTTKDMNGVGVSVEPI